MSNSKDSLKITGVFALQIIHSVTVGEGEEAVTTETVLESYEEKNLVVNGGLSAVAHLLGSYTADKNVNRISYGSNGSDPLVTDTAITDAFEKPLEATTYPATNSVAFAFALGLEENNGETIREFGLLCVDDTLFARKIRSAIAKTDEIRLDGVWTITFN